ncbi:unnamed protein product [Cylindrotheca closterium]|uniref:Ribonuclease II winged helix domain-containing protein n=1 Tax=Cylindrotheca closterium TaxID=2856 RepID=A0AAD2PXV0_9STRA|nr:unnamed protein product [Cylindrotheca closterium]
MNRLLLLCLLLESSLVESFQPVTKPLHQAFALSSKKDGDADPVVQQQGYAVGTFVEFEEKNRVHIGTIAEKENKASGGARYKVVDKDGHKFSIADKAVAFAMHAPNSPGQAAKLFDEFCAAQQASEKDLETKLEISPELLEMAWEESNLEETDMTPSSLVELVHAHAASAIEKYMAWRLLQSDAAHVFFKDIKDHGRVVSFKAKASKAVDAAKQAFCNTHEDSDICLV